MYCTISLTSFNCSSKMPVSSWVKAKLIQGDQLNMALFFWYHVKVTYPVYATTRVHWTSLFLQGTRKIWPCLTGHPVLKLKSTWSHKSNFSSWPRADLCWAEGCPALLASHSPGEKPLSLSSFFFRGVIVSFQFLLTQKKIASINEIVLMILHSNMNMRENFIKGSVIKIFDLQ